MYAPYEEQEIEELKEAIARVRELHKPYVDEPYTKCSGCLDDDGLPNEYPCPTIEALNGEQ